MKGEYNKHLYSRHLISTNINILSYLFSLSLNTDIHTQIDIDRKSWFFSEPINIWTSSHFPSKHLSMTHLRKRTFSSITTIVLGKRNYILTSVNIAIQLFIHPTNIYWGLTINQSKTYSDEQNKYDRCSWSERHLNIVIQTTI